MNALHKYVVREMNAPKRRELEAMRGMLDEGIRDLRNAIRADIARYKRAKKRRADIQKSLEAL